MDWKLYDIQNQYLQDVNCQYDSLDLAVMMYGATKVEVDFESKIARILYASMKLDLDELKKRFLRVGTWKNGSLHKPILILYSLQKLRDEGKTIIKFDEARRDLSKLYSTLNPSKRAHLEYPFVYLKNDGFWILSKEIDSKALTQKKLKGMTGGFTEDVCMALRGDDDLIDELINSILDVYFPKEMHERLLEAI